jgi:hypothetical protein
MTDIIGPADAPNFYDVEASRRSEHRLDRYLDEGLYRTEGQ